MPTEEFKCRRCGRCCQETWEIAVDFEKDILRWIREKRFDILKRVVLNPKFILNPDHFENNPQWMIDCGHVLFGDVKLKCPFLEDASYKKPSRCTIHETWPTVCMKFPFNDNGKVRTDVLDVCVGSIFFHSKNAEAASLSFIEYIEKISQDKSSEKILAPRKKELLEIAKLYKERFDKSTLKVNFTSEHGLKIAEGILTEIKEELEEKPVLD
jgi:Fe-S-cluster containining protein